MLHPYSHFPGRAAVRWPEQVALVDGGRRSTFAQLDVKATAIALALIRAGVEPGDRVAVLQHNCIEYVESVIAIARAGGVIVPLLGALTEAEHAFILENSGARFAIALTVDRVPHLLRAAGSAVEVLTYAPADGAACLDLSRHADEPAPVVDRTPDSLAQILYTSGTTGRPKGVTHSLATTHAAMTFWAQAFNLSAKDKLLGQLALSHFCGRAMDSAWVAGAQLIILPEAEPEAILQTIATHRVSVMLIVPTLLRMLLDHAAADELDLSSLRAVVYAASPAAPSLVKRALDRLGPVLYTGFGQTEAYGLNTLMGPEEHEQAVAAGGARLTSVGRTSFAAQIRIRAEDTSDCAVGETGEICIWAPWATPGFWRRPDLDEQRLTNGWLRTGDLGYIQDDGYIYLADRREDMIITGGFNVYPAEIENCLVAHEAVVECGAFSVPDPKWGEAVNVAVVLRPDHETTAEALLQFAKSNLARFKVPKAVHIVEELPKTAVGKILRRELRAPYWEGKERNVHGVS